MLVARFNLERCLDSAGLDMGRGGTSQGNAMGSQFGAYHVAFVRDPGRRRSILEAKPEHHLHGHGAAKSIDDAHEVGRPRPHRHEIDDLDSAVRGFDFLFEDQCVLPIAARLT